MEAISKHAPTFCFIIFFFNDISLKSKYILYCQCLYSSIITTLDTPVVYCCKGTLQPNGTLPVTFDTEYFVHKLIHRYFVSGQTLYYS